MTPRAVRLPKVPSHGRTGTSNRRRNAARCCPSARRSGAFARDGRIRRSSRSGWRQSRSPARHTARPSGACSPRRWPPQSVRWSRDREWRCDIRLTLGETGSQFHGGHQGCAGARHIALPHQDLCLAGMRQGEAGIGSDGAVIGCERAGVTSAPARWHRHRRLARRWTTWITGGRNDLPTSENPLWDPFEGYLPALRIVASYLAAGSRSSSQGVACSGKRRRAGGVVPLIGYVDRFSGRPGERIADLPRAFKAWQTSARNHPSAVAGPACSYPVDHWDCAGTPLPPPA